ncbi:ferredoxin-type protein essential for electron transfer from ubiquinol to periplasmic nitrate reductase (NapAB) [Candidatus Terasakiella magnetica]|nr:ferredoxin-type protein essential for electron transfer from ubiquinol to periplasmic nitrate reductase (NapAB) [Candidatus Terasakiella magnetica]
MAGQGNSRSEGVDQGRRAMLTGTVRGACAVGMMGALVAFPSRRQSVLPALRPPGAMAEKDFLSACVRCGLCVRDCPYGTLKLSDLGDGPVPGTPFFNARTVPCEMCETIPCVAACPTGALDKGLSDIKNAKMGVAVLVGHESCLNWLGLRCDVCYRVCPRIGEAITLEVSHNERTAKHARFIPTVHSAKCTGCGKCEKACVLDEAAIKVLPHALATGLLGKHYRLGWEEKARAGHSLVEESPEMPVRGMEGVEKTPSGTYKLDRTPSGGFKEFKP